MNWQLVNAKVVQLSKCVKKVVLRVVLVFVCRLRGNGCTYQELCGKVRVCGENEREETAQRRFARRGFSMRARGEKNVWGAGCCQGTLFSMETG